MLRQKTSTAGVKPQIRVLIADDHPIFRRGLRQAIETNPQIKVVAEAGDGAEALALLETSDAQIAVLDIDMPEQDGFAVAQAIAGKQLNVAVIFLTMHRDEHFFNAALDAGVKGYVLKDCAVLDIINSIKAVAAGENYISPQLATFLLARAKQPAGPGVAGPEVLTPAERTILKLVAAYKTSKEIAEQLGVSPRTVDNHRTRMAEKLNLKGPHALLKFALQHQTRL